MSTQQTQQAQQSQQDKTIQLTKPQFRRIAEVKAGKHCYNVYAKVIKATHQNVTRPSGDVIKVVEGVVADPSGCANFRFEGENADLVKEGATIAIRNGRSQVVNEYIRLEVDKFGRITSEDASNVPSTNTSVNISAEAYVKENKGSDRRGGDRDDRRGGDRDGRRGGDRDDRQGGDRDDRRGGDREGRRGGDRDDRRGGDRDRRDRNDRDREDRRR